MGNNLLRSNLFDIDRVRQFARQLGQIVRLLHITPHHISRDVDKRAWSESERQRILERIEREPTFLEAVLHHLPAGVLIVEAPSGRILFHNDVFVEIGGQIAAGVQADPGQNTGRFRFDRAFARAVARGELAAGKEVGFKRHDGTRGIAAVNTAPVKNASGQIIAQVAVFQDLTEHKVAEERIRRLALHDPLTGLPNRTLLLDRIGQATARACRDGDMFAVFLLDLDGFKEINDTLGHPAGDRLLCDVSSRITAAIRATDTLARLGGDEFALVQQQVRSSADATALATKVLNTFAAPFELDGHEVHAATSVGIAMFPQDGHEPGTLLKNADLALYRAKSHGSDRFCLFEPSMDEAAQTRRRLERELRLALERGEFMLHYQLQLELTTGRFTGAEALVRWNHPKRGLVMPDQFIPAAEANGLIRPLGAWILHEACYQARIWRELGWHLDVAVNLSPVQLRNGSLLPVIDEALKDADLEPARLELEITEGTVMENVGEKGGSSLRSIAADGVRLAIDDFGTGYSSLAYLKHLPVNTLKIDRSFVRDLGQEARDEALVRGIITLGQSLGKRVVAEGVENELQLKLLREIGCDEAQGYFIAMPQSAAYLERLLTA